MRKITLLFALFIGFSAQAKNIDVHMKNAGKDGPMSFEPGFSKVEVGDTITFIPTDSAHNSSSALTPEGAKGWVGKLDEKKVFKFEKEGIYIFKCDPHLPMGMAGVVQVGKPVNLDAAKAEADKMSKTFAMNKDRLSKYLAQAK